MTKAGAGGERRHEALEARAAERSVERHLGLELRVLAVEDGAEELGDGVEEALDLVGGEDAGARRPSDAPPVAPERRLVGVDVDLVDLGIGERLHHTIAKMPVKRCRKDVLKILRVGAHVLSSRSSEGEATEDSAACQQK